MRKQKSKKQSIEEKLGGRIISFDQLPKHLKMRGKIRGWIKPKLAYSPSKIYIKPTFFQAGHVFGSPISAEIEQCFFELEYVNEVETENRIIDIRLEDTLLPENVSITGFDEAETLSEEDRRPLKIFLRYATKDFLEVLAQNSYYEKQIADLIFGNSEKEDHSGRRWIKEGWEEKETHRDISLKFKTRKEPIQEWPPLELRCHSYPSNNFKSAIIKNICYKYVDSGAGRGLIWYYEPVKKKSENYQNWIQLKIEDNKLIAYPGKKLREKIKGERDSLKRYLQKRQPI